MHAVPTDQRAVTANGRETTVVNMLIKVVALGMVALGLAGCSDSPSAPGPAPAGPQFTLPAEMEPLQCSQLEPPPVRLDPAPKIVGRRCTDPDGSVRWGQAVYRCVDGSIWPVLGDTAAAPAAPTGPAFDTCLGR